MMNFLSRFRGLCLGTVLAIGFCSLPGHAHEHRIGTVRGLGIELKIGDHAVAGSIGEAVVFGEKLQNGATVIIKQNGHRSVADFVKSESGYGGIFRSPVSGVLRETHLEFVGIDSGRSLIHMRMNGRPFEVAVSAEKFEDNHFTNPTYSAEIDGRKVEFSLADAQACYGFSVQLVFMVMGSYLHLLP